MTERAPNRAAASWMASLFYGALVILAAAAAWWCLYFPYAPSLMEAAIPVSCDWISRHEGLAERWAGVTRAPLTRVLWRAIGGSEQTIVAMGAPVSEWERFARFVMTRRTVLAHSPSLPGSGEAAWMLVGWIGWRSNPIRWGLLRDVTRGFTKVQAPDGSRVWTRPCADPTWGTHISVAAAEGLFLACVSDDPTAVRYLVRRVRTRAPSVVEWPGHGTPSRDEAWMILRGQGARHAGRRVWLSAEGWGTKPTVTVRGWVGDWRLPPLFVPERALQTIPIQNPDAAAVFPFGLARVLTERMTWAGGARDILRYLARTTPDGAVAFVCALGGERSGRFLGIRVPSVMVGVQSLAPSLALANVRELVDTVNRDHGWMLIPIEEPGAGFPVIGIDTAAGGWLRSLRPSERPAVAAAESWIVMASNRDALAPLLATGEGQTRVAAPPGAAEDGRSLVLTLDASRAVPLMRNALSAYALARLATGGDLDEKSRQWIGRLDHFSDDLGGLGRVSFWIRPGPDGAGVEFEARYDPGPAHEGDPRGASASASR